jgi:hypothetical protein
MVIIAAIVVIAIVAVSAILLTRGPSNGTTTTSIGPSTTAITNVSYLSSCQSVSAPGSYYLSGNIKTTNTSAPCVTIASSDVSIICDGKSISGSGPYTGLPPFSYGIYASGVSNTTINGCGVNGFSYGVYSYNTTGLTVINSNVSTNYVSNIYLNNTRRGVIANSQMGASSSPAGSIYVTGSSSNNTFRNNTLINNVLVGFNISSQKNNFINNYVSGSAWSFVCNAAAGYPHSSSASSNVCTNQSGCSFLTCSGTNLPDNASKAVLGSSINSCGTISSPGTYSLAAGINMAAFSSLSIQQLAQYGIPCININAANVKLDCNGYSVSHAYEGIVVSAPNVTLDSCTTNSSDYGIVVNGYSQTRLLHDSGTGDNASIYVNGATGTTISNASSQNSTYGIYFSGSSGSLVTNMSELRNIYGVYLTGSVSNIFNKGVAKNNTRFDVYATSDSANRSTNLMLLTSCGLTNAQWASCAQHTSNSTTLTVQVFSCMKITKPGAYVLGQSLLSTSNNCISFGTDNVVFSCNGKSITTSSGVQGPAILISGRKNVTITNCNLSGFSYGINVSNSSRISISGGGSHNLGYSGISFKNVTASSVTNTAYVMSPTFAAMAMYKSYNNTILDNNFSGVFQNYGILANDSSNNIIEKNYGVSNYVGLLITGSSLNNIVQYNNFTASNYADYQCSAQNSNLNSEYGGINYGGKKIGCRWLAVNLPGSPPQQCPVATGGALYYPLQSDNVYGGGLTCFSIYSNQSSINCQGHTIIATNGGTFAKFVNSYGAAITGCYLKGFTQPIVVQNGSVTISNSTIYQNASTSGYPSITINKGSSVTLQDLNIQTAGTGISIQGVKSGTIKANNVSSGGTAYTISNSTSIEITNNTASAASGAGMSLTSSLYNVFASNHFSGKSYGLFCAQGAGAPANNIDSGGNICSSQQGCLWISSSQQSCP